MEKTKLDSSILFINKYKGYRKILKGWFGQRPSDPCPSEDFEEGTPSGECESDGHYRCMDCIHMKPKKV